MPPHHGVGLDEHERRAPLPPRLGEEDPKQSVSRAELRTLDRARQRGQLLTEREILERPLGCPRQVAERLKAAVC